MKIEHYSTYSSKLYLLEDWEHLRDITHYGCILQQKDAWAALELLQVY